MFDLEFLKANLWAIAILLGLCARPAADVTTFFCAMVFVEKSQRLEAIKAIRAGQAPRTDTSPTPESPPSASA
jgi:hypothetical protein